MKKVDRKLRLHRETLRHLEELKKDDLAQVKGGRDWTGCLSDCTECGQVVVVAY